MSMGRVRPYLYDTNDADAVAYCQECRGELYTVEAAEPDEWGRVLCPECRERLDKPRYDSDTVTLVMGVMDKVLERWLAEGPRGEIWNAVASRFPD